MYVLLLTEPLQIGYSMIKETGKMPQNEHTSPSASTSLPLLPIPVLSEGVRREIPHTAPANFMRWQKAYKWIEFFESTGKIYCFYCRWVEYNQKADVNAVNRNVFSKTGFSNFDAAADRLKTHEKSAYHCQAVLRASQELRETPSVLQQVSTQAEKQLASSTAALKVVFEALCFLASQMIALKGKTHASGNLRALLDLIARYNLALSEFVALKHNYLSNSSISEMLKTLYQVLLLSVCKKTKTSRHFALIADETTDTSTGSQLSIVIRHVTKDLVVHEDFVGFYLWDSGAAMSIFKALKDVLLRLSLDIGNLRGQCYDGANVMAGSRNGVRALFQKEQPKAFFVHCLAHRGNLVVKKMMNANEAVAICTNVATKIHALFCRSAIRTNSLRQLYIEAHPDRPDCKGFLSIKSLSATRWASRYSSFRAIIDNYAILLRFLDREKDSIEMHVLKLRLSSTTTYLYFRFCFKIFGLVHVLSTSLQSKANTLSASSTAVKTAITAIDGLVKSIDVLFKRYLEEAESKSICLTEATADNVADAKGVCLKLGSLCVEEIKCLMEADFGAFLLLEGIVIAFGKCKPISSEDIAKLACTLGKDSKELMGLHEEQVIFEEFLRDDGVEAKNVTTVDQLLSVVLGADRSRLSYLPVLVSLLRHYLVLPLSSASAERTFSMLRRLKTFLRSTMSQQTLNSLALLNQHKESLSSDVVTKAVQRFIDANPCRKNVFRNPKAAVKHRRV